MKNQYEKCIINIYISGKYNNNLCTYNIEQFLYGIIIILHFCTSEYIVNIKKSMNHSTIFGTC